MNDGRKTPGGDGELWDPPHKKLQGVTSLTARGYRLMALRRIYIPKANVVGTSQLFLPATQ